MRSENDMDLVRSYVADQSEAAFETLVSRHINLVYSAASRLVQDPHVAQDVTQAVFIIFARKAASLGPKTVLPSWLHRTSCFVARDSLKKQHRRLQREQEAQMQSLPNEMPPGPEENWTELAPLLDNAIANLSEKDRSAIVLRFFQNKSLADVGNALGTSEDSARMRVNRSLEKLRLLLVKNGVTSTAAVIAASISTHSVSAAPAGLAASIAANGAAAGVSTAVLVKGGLKLMSWAKTKLALYSCATGFLAISLGGLWIQRNAWGMSPPEILGKTRSAYASLTNYSSSGESISTTFVAESPDEIIGQSTNQFTLMLARPDTYRIEWENPSLGPSKGLVWSAGNGHFSIFSSRTSVPDTNALLFMMMTNFHKANDLSHGLSYVYSFGDLPGTMIPAVFYNTDRLNSHNLLHPEWHRLSDYVRKRDERINGVDCYILSASPQRERFIEITLWISKRDFLILQMQKTTEFSQQLPMRTDAEIVAQPQRDNGNRLSAETLAAAVRRLQEMDAKFRRPRRLVTTQTHNRIVVNQVLSNRDFEPTLPRGLGSPQPLP
jgi:RNA polymerase sigma factor (sigma-70 family)